MTKVYIAIQLVPAHQEDGRQRPASVESVFSNLPADYFDVRVFESELEIDANGDLQGFSTDFGGQENTGLKYPYEVFTRNIYPDDLEAEPRRPEEFSILFQERVHADVRRLLVINAISMEQALMRVRQTYPEAIVIRAEQNYGEHGETSRELLDQEILVVHPSSDATTLGALKLIRSLEKQDD
jgi:hypothetical protein